MPPDAGNNTPKSPRVLIVDDDAGQRSLLDSFLKSQGFDTVPVASGERALEVLRGGDFNIMISDVRMPGISGLETLRRARQQHAVLPVLLVTAYADIREAVGAMRDGAVNYLAKPIDLDDGTGIAPFRSVVTAAGGAGSIAGTSSAASSPVSTGVPPTLVATMGTPARKASCRMSGWPSHVLGRTNTAAAAVTPTPPATRSRRTGRRSPWSRPRGPCCSTPGRSARRRG